MKQEIQRCTEVLKAGGIILYPTDTIWGIGCDATTPLAVSRVYKIKERIDTRAMLVLVDSIDMIYDHIEEIPEMALEILRLRHSPGPTRKGRDRDAGSMSARIPDDKPLTIIYPGAIGLADNLLAEDGSIGIRITEETFSRELVRSFGKPIVSSSANISGESPPGSFAEISDRIRLAVDHIANWKQDENIKRKPSGILKVSLNGEIKIIRQ